MDNPHNVRIRPIDSDDYVEIYDIVSRNRKHLKNLKWVESATLDSVWEYLEAAQANEILRVITVSNIVAGLITLRDKSDHHEIGYWLDKEFCNNGVMTYAVGRICLLVNAPVFATIRVVNERSRRVLVKNGFEKIYSEGEWDWYKKN